MKLLRDANMPRSIKAALEQRDFDVIAVRDILPPATCFAKSITLPYTKNESP
jgi:hypothetical protein